MFNRKYGFKFAQHNEEQFDVYLYGIIGYDIDAQIFMNKMSEMPIGVRNVNLYLHSEGGIVTEGYAIMTNIQRLRQKYNITAHIDGSAFSMMSAIAIAADKTIASPTSEMMIHDPWSMIDIFGGYNKRELEVLIEQLEAKKESLDKDSQILSNVYADKTGLTNEEVKSRWLDDGLSHYLTPEEMLDVGLIDEIDTFESDEIPTFEADDFEQADFFAKLGTKKAAYRGKGEEFINRFALDSKISDSNNEEDEPDLNKNKGTKMDELQAIARELDMNENASEGAIRNEVARIVDENKTLTKRVDKLDKLIDDHEETIDGHKDTIKDLKAEARTAKTSSVVNDVIDEVESKKDNEGKEVNVNVREELQELALDYLKAEEEENEKAMKRCKQHMSLVCKDNLVPVGSQEDLDDDEGEESRHSEGELSAAKLKEAKKRGEEKRKAREARVNRNGKS